MSAFASIVVWAVWFGFTVAVILVDQRLRKNRVQDPEAVDLTSFENKSPWPYLALGVFCGALPLPIYFYTTRRSAKGALIGLGWVVASFALTVPIAIGAQWMGVRMEVSKTATACEAGKEPTYVCASIAHNFFRGIGTKKDPARAMAILIKTCERDDVDQCLSVASHLEDGEDGVDRDPEKARTFKKKAEDLCAKTPTASTSCALLAKSDPLALGDGGVSEGGEGGVSEGGAMSSTAEPGGGTKPTRAYCYAIMGADGPTCTDRHVSAFEAQVVALAAECESELDAASRRGRVKTDEGTEVACVAAHADHKPKAEDDPHPWRLTCDAFVVGLVDKGAACRAPFECKSHLACIGYTNEKDGTCMDPPKVGETCGTAHARHKILKIDVGDHPGCARGAHCLGDKCVARKPAGATCTTDEQCLETLACRVGKCGDPKTNDVGGACHTTNDCKTTLRCHREKGAARGKCVEELPAGAACTSHDECKGRCEKGTCKSICSSG